MTAMQPFPELQGHRINVVELNGLERSKLVGDKTREEENLVIKAQDNCSLGKRSGNVGREERSNSGDDM